jgi:hypothetical protein
MAVVDHSETAEVTLQFFDARGGAGKALTLLGVTAVSAIAFDTQGSLLVAVASGAHPFLQFERLLTLGPDGAERAATTSSQVTRAVSRIVVGARGTPILLEYGAEPRGDGDNGTRFATVDASLRVRVVPARVAGRLSDAVLDQEGRLVGLDADGVLRTDRQFTRVDVLRARLPGSVKGYPVSAVSPPAVDSQDRILIHASRTLEPPIDPKDAACDCREDVGPANEEILVRMEGGDRRVAVTSRRIGSRVAVHCLQAARGRCRGTLTVRRGSRPPLRVAVNLAAGRQRSFIVPSRIRRGATRLTVAVRVHDATGALITARRVLTR